MKWDQSLPNTFCQYVAGIRPEGEILWHSDQDVSYRVHPLHSLSLILSLKFLMQWPTAFSKNDNTWGRLMEHATTVHAITTGPKSVLIFTVSFLHLQSIFPSLSVSILVGIGCLSGEIIQTFDLKRSESLVDLPLPGYNNCNCLLIIMRCGNTKRHPSKIPWVLEISPYLTHIRVTLALHSNMVNFHH